MPPNPKNDTGRMTPFASSQAALSNIHDTIAGPSTHRQRLARGSVNPPTRAYESSSKVDGSTVSGSQSRPTSLPGKPNKKGDYASVAGSVLDTISVKLPLSNKTTFVDAPPLLREAAETSNSPLPFHLLSKDRISTPSLSAISSVHTSNNIRSDRAPTILQTRSLRHPNESRLKEYSAVSRQHAEYIKAQTSAYASPSGSVAGGESTASEAAPYSDSKPMNSGTTAKSAFTDSSFPCGYEECGQGFRTFDALKRHKYEEHDGYCERCDVDTPDHDTLTEHKIFSEKHIACYDCGKDFHCEAARDRHSFRDHPPLMNTRCVFCKAMFRGGAALISHHLLNECTDARGGERKLRESRVLASLAYDKMDYEATHVEKPKRPTFEDLTDAASSVGGVPLSEGDDILAFDDSSTVDGSPRSQATSGVIIDGLGALKLDSHDGNMQTWAKKLFPEAKQTPVRHDFILKEGRETPFSKNVNRDQRMSRGRGAVMKSDWDFAEFSKDDCGQFECPYVSCKHQKISFDNIDDLMEHLVHGDHLAIAEKCPKCHKRYDPIPALQKLFAKIEWPLSHRSDLTQREAERLTLEEINEKRRALEASEAAYRKMPALVRLFTHMERSENCNVKGSSKYGHYVHIMSGGFLRVTYDGVRRSCLVEADEPSPEPAAEPYETIYGDEF